MTKKETILKLAEKNACFYVYEKSKIQNSIRQLKENFPSVEWLYSMKCNSFSGVLKTVFKRGMGADAASLEEVKMAVKMHVPKEKIYYSAPGKFMSDIRASLPVATLIADSLAEVERIAQAVDAMQESEELAADGPVNIGVRINPEFTFSKNRGKSSKFGIDEEEVLDLFRKKPYEQIRFSGIHVHVKSQELDAEVLYNYYKNVLNLAVRVEETLGYKLDFINFGSGIGIPYVQDEAALNLNWLGSMLEELLAQFRADHPDTKFLIESGRFVVCEAGTYVTHVLDVKVSHGKKYVILHNTLNGFIRPCISQLVRKYSPKTNPEPTEPLFTEFYSTGIYVLGEESQEKWERVTLVGNLCTNADVVAEKILLPPLSCGDVIAFTNAGAYGAVLSPVNFSSQRVPAEIMID